MLGLGLGSGLVSVLASGFGDFGFGFWVTITATIPVGVWVWVWVSSASPPLGPPRPSVRDRWRSLVSLGDTWRQVAHPVEVQLAEVVQADVPLLHRHDDLPQLPDVLLTLLCGSQPRDIPSVKHA
eukprot:1195101-Prorocentrum_minimum.AAC.10